VFVYLLRELKKSFIKMNSGSSKITHQLKRNNYSYDKSILQQVQYKLISNITGKYSNITYVNGFIDFLVQCVFNLSKSTQDENRFNQLNILMLYAIYIIKNYECPNFNIYDIKNPDYKNKINNLLIDILRIKDNESSNDYYFDILRYLYIYNLIANGKYINL